MKKVLTLVTSLVMMISLASCASNTSSKDAIYKAGTYEASAQGMGEVTVKVTVDDTSIKSIEADVSNETESIGQAAKDDIVNQIIEKQSTEIDGVTGATITTDAIKNAVNDALKQAGLNEAAATEETAVADGTYTGKAASYGVMNEMELSVTFAKNKITNIETVCAGSATQADEDEYSSVYQTVEEKLFPRIIESQSLAVDSITGATVSSNAAKTIIKNIIDENGGNSSNWYTPVEKKTDTVKLEDYDVIVVGLGTGGMASYLSAVENGATVFGMEAAGKVGGNGTHTAGPLAVNPPSLVEANGGEKFVDEDELLQAWMEYTDNDAKEDLVKLMIDESGETLDWLTGNWDFSLMMPKMLAFYDSHKWPLWTFYTDSTGTSKELGYVNSLEKAKAMNEKNDYMTELKATDLIMDGDKVVGVKGEYYDGTTYEVYGKSVILATGGYIGNAEMCKKYTGYTWHTKAMTQCDGFAIREALELGGNLFNPDVAVEDHIAALDTIIRDSSVSVDDKALLTSLVTDTTYTMIDSNGELFDANYNGLGIDFNAWEAGSNYYVLLNEDEYNSIKENGIANFVSNANGFLSQGGTVEVNTPIENFDDILALGEKWNDVVIADSLSDLSDKLGVDIKINDVHGVTEGKVIAIKGAAYVYSTTGGVEVDTNINLVKEDGTPVENVYVVGNDSLGVLNESNKAYVTYGGCAQGWALTSGRLAGRNAAELAKAE